ncbi:hypothetical protein [Vibrio tapetis]|uniref:Uncharacterized protein n=1 Tax=Vibrio tapetis subsp. tapetis TaxID=1671868 RepID=A0A2N8ZGK2_9VIBR|nr:hypothetical protein [Vibrio tapetis]SON51033.1 conserved protein of unknown function [Vibrio tapetis subsp. tapetis]
MNILFICPDWANLASPIVSEMRRQGHDVIHLDHSDFADFRYYNKTHRLLSKAFDLIASSKYKHLRTKEQISFSLRGFFNHRQRFDIILMTEPNFFGDEHFDLFEKNTDKLVLSLWDSLERMPRNGTHLERFSPIFSFEPTDCEKHGFIRSYNYINKFDNQHNNLKYDLFSVMSFNKQRYQDVVSFLEANPHINANVNFYIDHPRKRKYITHPRVNIIDKLMLTDELEQNIREAKAVLDIGQGQQLQAGLSFRVYEALGFEKKLITTNSSISKYDFFNKKNIQILDASLKIEDSFFEAPYEKPDNKVLQKYTLSSWVENVIDCVSKAPAIKH